MFSKIVVALNDLPGSQRALCTAVDLARSFSAALATVSILGDLHAYASFAIVADTATPGTMKDDRRWIQAEMHDSSTRLAREHGVQATSAIVEGREVQAVLRFLKEQKEDLLVIALHQHDFYLSGLWSSVYDLAQDATCSVLGVH
jgi:nucleotide-binding universal stress UspA family protein